jgi:regulator of sigma E protease
MSTFIVFILILGVLVLVHELGHFLVAKRNGVISDEFGFGFPPRIFGTYKDKKGQRRWVFGNKEIGNDLKNEDETVYSFNLIPLGGFVKIRGEDGEDKKDKKSFANQSIWVRFKILFAGVLMNFILAIVLFSLAFQIGLPESVGDDYKAGDAKIQIAQVVKDSPAEEMGLEMGDRVLSIQTEEGLMPVSKIKTFQEVIENNKGKEISMNIEREGQEELLVLKSEIREEAPEGQGLLGVQLVRTTFARYGFFESTWMAIQTSFSMILAILVFLGDLIIRLFSSQPVTADVAGPVGIAVMTGKMVQFGLAYVFQFVALLSINLAVINLLPIPALDGGRIFFLLIEKIKGAPLSQKLEGTANAIGFFLLIILMVFVTVKDFANFQIIDKIKGIL